MKICIDAGHGGVDLGAIGVRPFRIEEKDFNLNLALLLEEELEVRGHWTVMTRRRDRSLSVQARAHFANRLGAEFFISIHANGAETPANFANRLGAEFFISIHANGAETPVAEGMEVYHFPDSAAGHNAASQVLDSMIASFPNHRNRGVKEANVGVLRLTDMPAILVESEFLTNPIQLQFLADEENQRGLAVAISNGIGALG
jgi:N-acetylmuramoyl-L-alanine amidase